MISNIKLIISIFITAPQSLHQSSGAFPYYNQLCMSFAQHLHMSTMLYLLKPSFVFYFCKFFLITYFMYVDVLHIYTSMTHLSA